MIKTHVRDEMVVGDVRVPLRAICSAYIGLNDTDDKWVAEGAEPTCRMCKSALARSRDAQAQVARTDKRRANEALREGCLRAAFNDSVNSYQYANTERGRGAVSISGEDLASLLKDARLNLEIAHSRLLSHMETLISSLTREVEDLKLEGLDARPNSLGVIQGGGSEIDRLTAEFCLARETFGKLVRFVEGARGTPGFQPEE